VEFGRFATTKVMGKHESLRAFSVSDKSITKRGVNRETTTENRTLTEKHEASVTKWIRSERQPSEAARQRAGELLGVPPDQLFSDERQLLVHSMQHRED
jgi:hypothetical protein